MSSLPGEAIFHISLPEDWDAARVDGRYTISTRGRSLAEEGFIHCSFAAQVPQVMSMFYADVEQVVVMRIDPHRLCAPLVVEDLIGGGEQFPHVYGPICLDAVIDVSTVQPAAMRACGA
ncbi:MAG: DUF952 domain-containing protein [Desertimonas sp.]